MEEGGRAGDTVSAGWISRRQSEGTLEKVQVGRDPRMDAAVGVGAAGDGERREGVSEWLPCKSRIGKDAPVAQLDRARAF